MLHQPQQRILLAAVDWLLASFPAAYRLPGLAKQSSEPGLREAELLSYGSVFGVGHSVKMLW